MKALLLASMLLALTGGAEAWGGFYHGYRYSLPGDWLWPSQSKMEWFKKTVGGDVYLKGDDGYLPYTFSTRTNTPKPAMMVYPNCIRDIQKTLRFARWHNMRISVLSTGHHMDVRNIADNAVHIVMYNFNEKQIIDVGDEKHIKVGPGQPFADISKHVQEATNEEWAIATGGDSTVGPYGWTTGGGHGYLSRLHGLGVDHVVSMRVVLTNGRVVTASEHSHKELFRSLRGSGGSAYGITVSMTIRLHPTPKKVTTFLGAFIPQSATEYDTVMQSYHNFLSGATKYAGGYYLTMGMIPGKPVFMITFCYGDDCDRHISKVSSLPNCIPGLLPGNCQQNNTNNYYTLLNSITPGAGGPQYSVSTSVTADKTYDLIKATTAWVTKDETYPMTKFCTQTSLLGGEMKNLDVDGDDTSVAPAMRNTEIQLTCVGTWAETATVDQREQMVADMDQWGEDVVRPFGTGWVYWNEPQHNFPENDWKERYWGSMENYNRLLGVKRVYDPFNAITCYHCVGWNFADSVDPAVCPEQDCTCSNNPSGACN
eukprot:TRINITY_DN25_c0_g1_i7.p1 TRINITY_DN25_c0_g1~~TRINITY_DN25_c0_g1_i7.p1  ORF type:complete len:539 (+),score=145.78 TRINITY_DN25_c0_g1_i7:140-1756(+)